MLLFTAEDNRRVGDGPYKQRRVERLPASDFGKKSALRNGKIQLQILTCLCTLRIFASIVYIIWRGDSDCI